MKNKKIKISVIVPVYNTEKYLNECLNSLVNQTIYKELEIICINDASTDNSLKILEGYEKQYENLIVINSNVNKKQGGARNLGIMRATGEYLGFVDSDDFVDLEMYEKLYNEAIKKDYDAVESNYYDFYGENNLKKVELLPELETGVISTETRKRLLLNGGILVSKIVKRKIIVDNKIKFPENLFYEDSYFIPFVLLRIKSISKINDYLYFCRKTNISTTRSIDNYSFFDILETSKILLMDMKNEKEYNIYKEEIEFRFIELFYIYSIVGTVSGFTKYEKERINYIKSELERLLPDYQTNIYFKGNKYNKNWKASTKASIKTSIKASIKASMIVKFPKFMFYMLKPRTKLKKRRLRKMAESNQTITNNGLLTRLK